ncbi:MAG: hypothetical protein Q7Q71_14725 [Verrucomicrobiota bacterium JB023]|nr:hypothetical protein [Verrucomicrobiota bacterium JB023]
MSTSSLSDNSSPLPSPPPARQAEASAPQDYVTIEHLETFEPFFFSLVSPGDQWMFLSSHGSLAAGRESAENSLFPYQTVDKIMDSWNSTGPWTALQSGDILWNPFTPSLRQNADGERRLSKSVTSDEVIFEERHDGLDLVIRYRWRFSASYGFVRTTELINRSEREVPLRLVDGIDNFLPAGVSNRTQLQYSCLADGYKHSELLADGRLLIHRLASGITDEPKPLESLLATTVWTHGLEGSRTLLTRPDALTFLRGQHVEDRARARGKRGAFFLAHEVTLAPRQSLRWHIVADINKTQAETAKLLQRLNEPESFLADVFTDIEQGRQALFQLVASSDGVQHSAERDVALYHYQNTLCNIMRGGVPEDGYSLRRAPFLNYLQTQNRPLASRHEETLLSLPESLPRRELLARLSETGDVDLLRLATEYLPLVMSRRHGDPSRPWNRFFIRNLKGNESDRHHYEGNWRDIFQNWKALALSFPEYLPAFISKFLNASTIDGYNPYRVTSEGVDWEVPDPEDPWASIGYWGDHQIIYLLKLLEMKAGIHPKNLANNLDKPNFVFVDVPYRLKSWEEILANPRASIRFDWERHENLHTAREEEGADAFLLRTPSGEIVRATMLEKLLIPALVKLANLVPGGGIWMNTQRPEWNDANNALAGPGLSVVTTAYLHRYFSFLKSTLGEQAASSYQLSPPLARFLTELGAGLASPRWLEVNDLNGEERFQLAKKLGLAGQQYREAVYAIAEQDKTSVSAEALLSFLERASVCLRATLRENQRPDGLWHAYNVLVADGDSFTLRHLQLMLEGQVAILTSGILGTEEAADLLDRLATSKLRSDRHPTYTLYPDAEIDGFLESNQVTPSAALAIPGLAKLIAVGDESLLVEDSTCGFRFHADLTNAAELDNRVTKLSTRHPALEADRAAILALYEETFQHRMFTGRSGRMFSYEGLGCVYWHMVSKLLVATQEVALSAVGQETFHRLAASYHQIQSGLGFRQTARSYGAFPHDPYSHSPGHGGAQQPGLTGHAKEGIIARFGELGVRFERGLIRFQPKLLRRSELTTANPSHPEQGSLRFTYANTPIIYSESTEATDYEATVFFIDGGHKIFPQALLSREVTCYLVSRDISLKRIEVTIPSSCLLDV